MKVLDRKFPKIFLLEWQRVTVWFQNITRAYKVFCTHFKYNWQLTTIGIAQSEKCMYVNEKSPSTCLLVMQQASKIVWQVLCEVLLGIWCNVPSSKKLPFKILQSFCWNLKSLSMPIHANSFLGSNVSDQFLIIVSAVPHHIYNFD